MQPDKRKVVLIVLRGVVTRQWFLRGRHLTDLPCPRRRECPSRVEALV